MMFLEISIVRGCNRDPYCRMCGINATGLEHGSYHYMSDETFDNILDGVSSTRSYPRICFAGHGEPTLHPKFSLFVKKIRDRFKNQVILLATNGEVFQKKLPAKIKEWLDCGLDVVIVDTYEPKKQEIRDVLTSLDASIQVISDDVAPLCFDPFWSNLKRTVIIYDDPDPVYQAKYPLDLKRRFVYNHGGYSLYAIKNAQYKGFKCIRAISCAFVAFDGSVLLCCNDWTMSSILGNVKQDRLDYLWDKKTDGILQDRDFHVEHTLCLQCNDPLRHYGVTAEREYTQWKKEKGERDAAVIQCKS